MKRALAGLITVAAVAGLSTHALAAGDAEAGKAKSNTCVACHGQDGIGTAPIYPNLCGQKEQYLVAQITAFRDGERQNQLMQPMVANLSDQDIEDLAAYYSSLDCPSG